MPESFALRVLVFALPVLLLVGLYYFVFFIFRSMRRMRRVAAKTGRGRVVLIRSAKHLVVEERGRSRDLFLAYIALAEDVHDAEVRARRLLAAMLEGQEVAYDIIVDHGDSIVAAITQPVDVAAELIGKGLCYARMDAPPSYRALQERAIQNGSGLWKAVRDEPGKGTARYTKP